MSQNRQTAYTINAVPAVAEAALGEYVPVRYVREGVVNVFTGAAGEKFAGFTNMTAPAGLSVGVVKLGRVAPVASGAIVAGDKLTAAAGGKVKVATGAAGETIVGTAESDAVDGERVSVSVYGTN
ncbi:hypothetical protein [Deinococcus kurensis]|uniref:hypothetical protein n=1 Tax=Deinococcus kurensis TaxID=2662757 RepID=UPI0012D3010C|nr:hypothetical protein [Deinococcus kurensis]